MTRNIQLINNFNAHTYIYIYVYKIYDIIKQDIFIIFGLSNEKQNLLTLSLLTKHFNETMIILIGSHPQFVFFLSYSISEATYSILIKICKLGMPLCHCILSYT